MMMAECMIKMIAEPSVRFYPQFPFFLSSISTIFDLIVFAINIFVKASAYNSLTELSFSLINIILEI